MILTTATRETIHDVLKQLRPRLTPQSAGFESPWRGWEIDHIKTATGWWWATVATDGTGDVGHLLGRNESDAIDALRRMAGRDRG